MIYYMSSARDTKTSILAFFIAFRSELLLGFIAIGIIIISLTISLNTLNKVDEPIQFQQAKENPAFDTATVLPGIFVDIQGAIEKPDVYEVTVGARLKDVLVLAHGLSVEADRKFFAQTFNLAKKVTDQEKIYIPSEEEVTRGQIAGASIAEKHDRKTNINTASSEELERLPGIGAVTTEKIIEKRPYASIDELLNKKIVGKSVFEKIKDLITVE